MAEFDTHHLLPSSVGGSSHPDNLVKLKVNTHRSLHHLFTNLQPPEQMIKLMLLNDTCLTDEFKTDMRNILTNHDPDYYYKKGIIKSRKKLYKISD